MRRLLSGTACLGIAVVVLGGGCSGGRPSVDTSTTEATVSGIIKVRGKPVTGGKVAFDPSNVERKSEPARTAEIGKDGSYTVKTLVGMNMVSFSGPQFAKERELQDVNTQYNVQSGEQTYNIDLPEGTSTP